MRANANAVLTVVGQFLERIEKKAGDLSKETPLYANGVGIDSVEAAELSAVLEDEFGSDPFSAGEVPETVGDVVAFYENATGV